MVAGMDEYDKVYCYPESNVLKNKLGIRDPDKLHNAERDITGKRIHAMHIAPVKGNLDFSHLKNIHKNVFSDLYEWAGKPRTVGIAKGNHFCLPQHITYMANETFGSLQKENYLIGCPKDNVASRMAYYFGELNALHSFREGNGRTQREFIKNLAAVSGHEINYAGIGEKEMLEASIETFDLKYGKMEALFKNNMRNLSYKEQLEWCEKIASPSGSLAKVYKKYFQYINRVAADIENSGFKATDVSIRKMERLHQKSGKEFTLNDVHHIIKKGTDKDNLALVQDIGKEFAAQERKIQIQESGPEAGL